MTKASGASPSEPRVQRGGRWPQIFSPLSRLIEIFDLERIHVDRLTPLARLSLTGCLIAATALAYLLLALAGGWGVPGSLLFAGSAGEPPLPLLVVVFTSLALAVAAGTLAQATITRPGAVGVATRLLLLLPAAIVSSHLIDIGQVLAPEARWLTLVLGSAAAACTLTLAVLSRARLAAHPWLAASLAAVPYVALPVALAFAAQGGEGRAWDERSLVANVLVFLLPFLGFPLALLIWWQAIEGVRAVVLDVGRGISLLAHRAPWLLSAVLTAKLVGIALAYALLADGESVWQKSRFEDGALAWALAAIFALAATVWVARGPARGIVARRAGHLERAAWLVGVGFSLLYIVSALLALLAYFAEAFPDSERIASRLLSAADDILGGEGEHALRAQAAVVYLALLVSAVLFWRRIERVVAAFLLLFALWALPVAIAITIEPYGGPGPAAFTLVSFDTAFTLALALLLVGSWLRLVTPPTAGLVMLALAASTVIAYTGTLVSLAPPAVLGVLFALGLLFPVVWQFLADAGELNRGAHSHALVLAVAGLAVAALGIAVMRVAVGYWEPGEPSDGDVAYAVLAIPLAAVLVATLTANIWAGAAPTPQARSLGRRLQHSSPKSEATSFQAD